MPLFNQSAKTVSAVIDEIADSMGASADSEMRTRAMRSLNATIGHFNTRAKWDWMLTEANPVSVVAPFEVAGVSASAGQSSALAPSGSGFLPDDLVSFAGVGLGTRVSATATAAGPLDVIGLTAPIGVALGTGTQTVTAGVIRDHYAVSSAWKSPYQIKTLSNQQALRPIRRRFYGRTTNAEFTPSTPVGYDILPITTKGKVRILPPSSGADILQMHYYRRITPASAANDGTTFDVPFDCEPYLIAYAKWHAMTDKGEGKKEQAQTWLTFAEDGIKTMLAEQTTNNDEDLSFQYGAASYNVTQDPNSTRSLQFDYS